MWVQTLSPEQKFYFSFINYKIIKIQGKWQLGQWGQMVKGVFSFHFIIIRLTFEPRKLLRINLPLNYKILIKSHEPLNCNTEVLLCSFSCRPPWAFGTSLHKGENDMSIFSTLCWNTIFNFLLFLLIFKTMKNGQLKCKEKHLLPYFTKPEKTFKVYSTTLLFQSYLTVLLRGQLDVSRCPII